MGHGTRPKCHLRSQIYDGRQRSAEAKPMPNAFAISTSTPEKLLLPTSVRPSNSQDSNSAVYSHDLQTRRYREATEGDDVLNKRRRGERPRTKHMLDLIPSFFLSDVTPTTE